MCGTKLWENYWVWFYSFSFIPLTSRPKIFITDLVLKFVIFELKLEIMFFSILFLSFDGKKWRSGSCSLGVLGGRCRLTILETSFISSYSSSIFYSSGSWPFSLIHVYFDDYVFELSYIATIYGNYPLTYLYFFFKTGSLLTNLDGTYWVLVGPFDVFWGLGSSALHPVVGWGK